MTAEPALDITERTEELPSELNLSRARHRVAVACGDAQATAKEARIIWGFLITERQYAWLLYPVGPR